jgi:hypothetical protein
MMATRKFALVALLALGMLGGCAQTEVKAWEKSALAKPAMALNGNVLEARFSDHTFQSKEGSRGTGSVGGGGCGCN